MTRIVITMLYLLLASISSAAESTYCPTDAERARWTMSDMMSWKTVFEAYKVDYNGYPVITKSEEALKFFEPVYIRKAPVNDAWGRPYRIESDGKTFRVVSGGADGIFQETTPATAGRSASFNDDAIVSNEGRWLFRAWEHK